MYQDRKDEPGQIQAVCGGCKVTAEEKAFDSEAHSRGGAGRRLPAQAPGQRSESSAPRVRNGEHCLFLLFDFMFFG